MYIYWDTACYLTLSVHSRWISSNWRDYYFAVTRVFLFAGFDWCKSETVGKNGRSSSSKADLRVECVCVFGRWGRGVLPLPGIKLLCLGAMTASIERSRALFNSVTFPPLHQRCEQFIPEHFSASPWFCSGFAIRGRRTKRARCLGHGHGHGHAP